MSSTARTRHVTLIAAYARGRIIGNGPDIPWHSPEDFAHFKTTTHGHTLIMGRVTFESIGRPLPGRRTIVVTRDRAWSAVGVETAHAVEDALALAASTPEREAFVAGGAQIYAAALPYATRQVLTEIHLDVAGDAFYPDFAPDEWAAVRRDARGDASPSFDIVWWERASASRARGVHVLPPHTCRT